MKKNIITLENTTGDIKDYEVLFTYTNNDKNYIIYTLDEEDKEGFIKFYAGILSDDKLLPLENDEEWEMVDKLISKLDGE